MGYNSAEKEKYIIYTLKGCSGCVNAKKNMKKHGISFIEKDILENKDEVQKLSGGYKYAPAIFTSDMVFIGGNDELNKHLKK